MLTISLPLGHTQGGEPVTRLAQHAVMHMHYWPAWALACIITALGAVAQGHHLALVACVAGCSLAGLARPQIRGFALLLAVSLSLGGARQILSEVPDPWRDLDGLRLDASGTIRGQVRSRDESVSFLLDVERIEGRPELVGARVWAVWHAPRPEQPQPLTGERWRLQGRLATPRGPAYPGAFDQQAWLARHGIAHELHGWGRHDLLSRLSPARGPAWGLRVRLLDLLRRGLTERQHGLLCGVVLGETQFLSSQDEENFRATGTSHLLAASGMNVALMVTLVAAWGRALGFGPGRSALPALGVALFYTVLAEASPSVVRAAAMAAAGLTALAVGRVTSILHSLTLACLGCILLEPAYLQDLGFQMSVLAVLSLVFLQPGFAARLEGLPRLPRDVLATTLAATLGLLPWMVWNFQQWAPATLLANLAMGLVAEALLPLGLLQALLQALSSWVAAPLVGLNAALLDYLLGTASLLAHWFGPGQLARPDRCQLAGLCLLVGMIALWLYRQVSWHLLVAADLMLVLLWLPAPGPRELRLRLASPLAWVSLPGGRELLLGPSERLSGGLRMLRVHGAWPDQVLEVERSWQLLARGVSLTCRDSSCRLVYGRSRLLLAWRDPPPELRGGVDVLVAERRYVQCQLWVRPRQALELSLDGRRIGVARWQENEARVRNERPCESTGCSWTSAGKTPPPTASGSSP